MHCLGYSFCSLDFGQYIWLKLQAIGDAVGGVEEIHHCHDLDDGCVVQSQPLDRGRVRVDSIGAAVGRRNCQGNDLFGAQVELATQHHRFVLVPGGFQVVGESRHGAPVVGDKINSAGALKILEDLFNFPRCFCFADQTNGGHTFFLMLRLDM